ncbi:non-ribosomal peptide synthetase [Luteibacter sp. 9135]|uniref:non-ribosomal peptide synthetase n=1 Tax=Luteibacter sp. 9135 TaxID=1500893 RepID=UPI00163ADD37|nr:non-ribosomal peptide synthetase [Luteibacter sp. 9135]
MTIQHLLKQCLDGGIRLAESDGQLHVRFDGQPPAAALLEQLKLHKHDLIRHLRAQQPGAGETIRRVGADVRKRVRASAAQRRMWLIDRFEQAHTPYNMVGAYRLTGDLDLDALALAVDDVVARHESLRTSFAEVDGELFQVVGPAQSLVWDRADVSALEASDREQAVQVWLRRENGRRFDLSAGPVIHVATLRVARDQVVFVMTFHHIACDGWSIDILKRDISRRYGEAVGGGQVDWTPPLQYVDYCEWERSQRSEARTADLLAYWMRKLDGLPQLHGLPLDRPRPALQTYTGRQVRRHISRQSLGTIRACCQAHDATLFAFVHMAFAALVALYSEERDIVIGFAVAGRAHRDADETVGLFVNTVVLRSQVDGGTSFDSLLDQSKRNLAEAISHQDLPFEVLLETLKPTRSRAHGPLLQLLLTVHGGGHEFALPNLAIERLENPEQPVKFDLQLDVEEREDGLQVTWHFNADLFDPRSIERMADGFNALADIAASDGAATPHSVSGPTTPMRGLASSTPARRLEAVFEEHARAYPDRPAVVFRGEQLSYRELDEQAHRLAWRLRSLGVGRGDFVGLCTDRSVALVVGIMGTLKAGAAYVPLDMSLPAQRLAAMISDCAAPVLLGQRQHEALLAVFNRPVLFLDDEPVDGPSNTLDRPDTETSDAAYLIYTSGTTGIPKGVAVSHASAHNLLAHFANLVPMPPPWNGSLWSSASFDVSVYEIFSPLCAGGCLHIVPETHRLDPDRLLAWMAEHEIHSAYVYAGHLDHFGDHLSRTGNRPVALRRMLVGVEPISSGQLDAIATHVPGLRIINGYGPTEATVCCTTLLFQPATLLPATRVPIGQPVARAELYVMNAGGTPALPGALGELFVGGIGLAIGYLNQPDMTRDRFADVRVGGTTQRFYRTGDVVRHLPSGDLEFIGRADAQVKIRGFRVELGEIEVRLCAQEGVRDAAVITVGEGIDRKIAAFVVPKTSAAIASGADAHALEQSIRAGLKAFLPDYMVPAYIVPLDALPMTANGKVDRARLPVPSLSVANAGAARVAPRSESEKRLLAIWQDVLGQQDMGVTDDFFALGGHSLHIARMTNRMRQQFQLAESDIPLETVFENPTVESLAVAVEAVLRRNRARSKEQYLASLGDSVEIIDFLVAEQAAPAAPRPAALAPLTAVADRASAPMSGAQQRVWFAQQQSDDGNHFNIQGCFTFDGTLDLASFERAIGVLLQRHEVLRTTFAERGGSMERHIQPPGAIPFSLIDLSPLSWMGQVDEVRALIAADLKKRFDLARDVLLRVMLLRLSPERHVAVFNVHHIASDGWTVGLLVKEFCAAYAAYAAGESVDTMPASLQYADFAHWQHAQLQGGALDAGMSFWRSTLAGVPNVHGLPLDKPRPAKQTFRGELHRTLVGSLLGERIRQYCHERRVTLFMFLETALAVLLSLYGDENDIVVGTPVAGRMLPETEQMVGLFINTVVLRCRVDPAQGFDALLQENKRHILAALANQHVPFERVAEDVGHRRSLSHSPVFQLWFVLQNNDDIQFDLPGCAVGEYKDLPPPAAKYELNVYAREVAGAIELDWVFNDDLFDEPSIRYVAGEFVRLLQSLVDAPEAACHAHAVFDGSANAPASEPLPAFVQALVATDSSLLQHIGTSVATHEGRPAVVTEGTTHTYSELDRLSEGYAAAIAATASSGRVGLLMERGANAGAAMLAALKLGRTYVPLDTGYPHARLSYMVQHSECDVIVCDPAHRDLAAALSSHAQIVDAPAAALSHVTTAAGQLPRAPAYILYTSGSTGHPKGVSQSHKGLGYHAGSYAHALGLTHEDTLLQLASYNFDASVLDTYGALLAGAAVHLADAKAMSRDSLLRLIGERGITVYHSTPTVFKFVFSDASPGSLAAIRAVVLGGEPIDALTVQLFHKAFGAGCRLIGLYGATESSLTTLGEITREQIVARRRPGMGQPIPGTHVRVQRDDGSLARVFEPGQIVIRSDHLAEGYWRAPKATAEKFLPVHEHGAARHYLTGDAGYMKPDGEICFMGRLDFQVKLNGIRIELGEIESVLLQRDDIEHAAAVVSPGENATDAALVACVVSGPGSAAQDPATRIERERSAAAQLRAHLKQWLPDYMVPGRIVFMDRLPQTPSGKIDRRILAQTLPPEIHAEPMAPRNPLEEGLVELWRQVLDAHAVGVQDDFFLLGGHSLKAMRLLASMERTYGTALSMKEFFDAPTVEACAAWIRLHGTTAVAPPLGMPSMEQALRDLESTDEEVEEGLI